MDVDPKDMIGNTRPGAVLDSHDLSLYKRLGVPTALHDVMDFAGVQFRHRTKGVLMMLGFNTNDIESLDDWLLCMPVNIAGKRVEIPLPAMVHGEEHWRAILAAAADFQYLVNSGQYECA